MVSSSGSLRFGTVSLQTGLDEDGDALREADDEAWSDRPWAFDFDEVAAGATQSWFGGYFGHARKLADFARGGRRWILGRLPLIESCRRRKIDPWKYIVWIFEELPRVKVTADTFEKYTPAAYAASMHKDRNKKTAQS